MAIAATLVLTGCGAFQPFATPFVPRPALPAPQPFPGTVEDLVAELAENGVQCSFSPESDIPAAWHCGDQRPATNRST